MAWADFLSTEWRTMLRPKLEEAEQLIAAGKMTRDQAESIVKRMREIALLETSGAITEAHARELVEQHAVAVANNRGSN